MNTVMLPMLRTLTTHLDQHDLGATVTDVKIHDGKIELYLYDRERGMVATLTSWAVSLGEVALTASPGSSGYDYVRVELAGRLADQPIEVRWIASGADAAGLRHLLGFDTPPPTAELDLAALAGLHTATAA